MLNSNETVGKRFIPLVVKPAAEIVHPLTRTESSEGQKSEIFFLKSHIPTGLHFG